MGVARQVLSDSAGMRLPLGGNRDRGMSLVVLEYRQAGSAGEGDPSRLRPALPSFDIPCLHFTWSLDPGVDRTCVAAGPGLVPADPGPRSWSSALLRGSLLERSPRLTGHVDEVTRPVAEALHRRAMAASRIADVTLGAMLLDLSRGSSPLVIDRVSLENERLGPGSRISASSDPLLATVIPIGSRSARSA